MPITLVRALSDGVVSIHPFAEVDRDALVAGRDAEFHRFLGPGDPSPTPICTIRKGEVIVGWIDVDDHRPWLAERDVNLGYSVFGEHRGHGYATRAVNLMCRYLATLRPPREPTLLIDPHNTASQRVAAHTGFVPVDDIDGQQLFRRTSSGVA